MIWLLLGQLLTVDVVKAPALETGQAWVVPAELDGDPATREWIAWGLAGDAHGNWFRAVGADRQGRLCVGDWFWPWPTDGDWYYGYVGRAGDRDRLLIQSTTRYLEVTILPCR